MLGKLITTYVANVDNIAKEDFFQDAIKLYVARRKDGFDGIADKGFKHILALAPDAEILARYKDGELSWDEYVMAYRIACLLPYTKMRETLKLIETRLREGRNVIFCCYEKDYKKCHRFILSNYFAELGFECGEYGVS